MEQKPKDLARWNTIKMYLQEKFEKTTALRSYFSPRGSIYTCHLGENIGDEKNGMGRPVLIVSSDSINRVSGNVVIVTLSKQIKWIDPEKKVLKYNTHYVLYKKDYPNLQFDSAIQCEDIRSVSKARLGKFICQLDPKDIKNIRKRLKSVLQV